MRRIIPRRDWRLHLIDLRAERGDDDERRDHGIMTPELAEIAR